MTLKTLVEDFFASGHEAASSDDMTRLHAFRVSAKRLRYSIEIMKPKHAKQHVEKLRKIQDIIGDCHDAAVAKTYLCQLAPLSSKAARIPNLLKAKTKKHRGEFQKYWHDEFEPQSTVDDWMQWATKN